MPKVKLTYGQPRSASYDENVVIAERKEKTFEGDDAEIALAIEKFLDEGMVPCGEKLYTRSLISVEEILPLPPVLQPNPAFCRRLDYID